MPAKLHRNLVKAATKKSLVGKAFDRYVHGTMAKLKKKRKKKSQLARPAGLNG